MYLDNFDSEEWLLDQVLTKDLANSIQVGYCYQRFDMCGCLIFGCIYITLIDCVSSGL